MNVHDNKTNVYRRAGVETLRDFKLTIIECKLQIDKEANFISQRRHIENLIPKVFEIFSGTYAPSL